MGLDQLHEQNNKYIKGVSGDTSLVNMMKVTFDFKMMWRFLRILFCNPFVSQSLTVVNKNRSGV